MSSLKQIIKFISECLFYVMLFLCSLIKFPSMAAEIVLLRSQLSLCQQQIENGKRPKPRATQAFRLLAILAMKWLPKWKSALVIIKPKTVIRWHRAGFKLFWRFKSKKPGRPKISQKTIALIKKIHTENPLLSPEKIYDCDKMGLLLAFNYT